MRGDAELPCQPTNPHDPTSRALRRTLSAPVAQNGERASPAASRRLSKVLSIFALASSSPSPTSSTPSRTSPGQDGRRPLPLSQSSPQVKEGGKRECFSFSGEGWRLPLTGIDLLSLCALLAFHVAAPAHLALAGPGYHPALGVVAPAAADGVAVLVLVALAGGRARGVLAGAAEAGRVLDVEEVRGAGDLVAGARQGLLLGPGLRDVPLARGLVGGAAHLEGRLVAELELLADLVERRQLPPAGLHRAGP